MVKKHKQKKKKHFKNYGKSNKELNALIEKKFQRKNSEVCQEQEKEENREGIATFSRNAAFRR